MSRPGRPDRWAAHQSAHQSRTSDCGFLHPSCGWSTTASVAERACILADFRTAAGNGGPRNRTWRCGFGDRRVTDTPVPRRPDCRRSFAQTDRDLASMRAGRLELPRALAHWLLRPACLPVPPRPRAAESLAGSARIEGGGARRACTATNRAKSLEFGRKGSGGAVEDVWSFGQWPPPEARSGSRA